MADLKMIFDVTGTEIALRERTSEVTSGSLRADRCCFYFDSAWNDFGGKIAFFGADRDRLVPSVLTAAVDASDNTYHYCNIPRSVLSQCGGGSLYICVQGADNNSTPDNFDDDSILRSKLYRVTVADSGGVQLYITSEETVNFLNRVSAALSTMRTETSSAMATQRAENAAAIAALSGRAIHSAVINQNHELVLSMEDGTVFNLGNVRGPQGIQGQTGAKGDTGEKGEKGDTGEKGEKGDTGEKGEKGDTGARGEKGDTGEKGEKGDTGEKGEKGDTGEQGMSIIGPQGPRGQTGAKGDTGVGIRSISVLSNGDLSITLSDGSVCEPGNIKGPAGEIGQTGATGATGPQGPKGDPGADGYFSVSENGVNYKVELQLISGAPCLVCTELESEEENDA